jgi:hypothetical protein
MFALIMFSLGSSKIILKLLKNYPSIGSRVEINEQKDGRTDGRTM